MMSLSFLRVVGGVCRSPAWALPALLLIVVVIRVRELLIQPFDQLHQLLMCSLNKVSNARNESCNSLRFALLGSSLWR